MEPSTHFLAVALISLIAAVSPGPDFFIVFRNSLVYSRKAGIMTSLGVATALIVHLTYSLVGIGVLIAESPWLYTLVKYSGVAYLFYIGLKGIVSSYKHPSTVEVNYAKETIQISTSEMFMQGFWTNLLNPKAAIFFISLFSQFIDASTSVEIGIAYGVINWTITLGWFLMLSYLLTHNFVIGKIHRFRVYIDRVMGVVLMTLGVRMLFV